MSERTIEADIRAMRYDQGLGYNAPIKMDRTRGVYFYEEPDFSIDNIPLNEAELDSLVFASRLLEQFKDISLFKTFNGSIQKLVDAVNVYRHSNYDDIRSFIEFEQVEFTKGTKYLEPLINAIRDRDVIKIQYRSFTSKRNILHVIHPYHLKEYRNRWFLIGYCDKYSGIRTYGLDRILDIQVENGLRFKDVGFDAKTYYENVIGVSVLDDDPVEIHIAFSELQTQYILSQPLHRSQEYAKKLGNRYVYKYYLVPNFEFYSQVSTWGENAEIIKPISIRNIFERSLKKTLMLYQS